MLGISVCGIAGYSDLTTNVWINTAGGAFSDGGNWSSGIVPDSNVVAQFTNKNTYTVSFTRDETNAKLDVAYDTVTFNMNGFTNYAVISSGNGLTICGGGVDYGPPTLGFLTITNGAIIVPSAGVNLGSYVSWNGKLIVEKGGKLKVYNGVNIDGQGKLIVTNGGQVEITFYNAKIQLSGAMFVDGINSLVTSQGRLDASTTDYGPNTLRVSGGAKVKTPAIRQMNTNCVYTLDGGTLYLGNGTTINSTFTNYFLGTLQGNGTIDVFTDYGPVYTNSMFGKLIPGCTNTIGALTFTNGVLNLMPSCTVAMEIGGATNYDRLYASNLVFNGTCTVSMVYGYRPMRTEHYKLFDWVTQSGAFATWNLPVIHGVTWDTNSIYTTGELIAIFPAGTIISIY